MKWALFSNPVTYCPDGCFDLRHRWDTNKKKNNVVVNYNKFDILNRANKGPKYGMINS